jgi:hypothetical protein
MCLSALAFWFCQSVSKRDAKGESASRHGTVVDRDFKSGTEMVGTDLHGLCNSEQSAVSVPMLFFLLLPERAASENGVTTVLCNVKA